MKAFRKVLLVMALLAFAVPVFADYVDVSGVDKWSRVDTHTIILYQYGQALCLVKVPYGYIYSSSEISFPDTYIGPWSKIIIDGEVEDITVVTRLN